MGLTLLNCLLLMQYFFKSKITPLPSAFVFASPWLILSAIPAIHTSWQAQFVIAGVILACTALLRMNFRHQATEEAFLSALLCCIVAVVPVILYIGIVALWVYLIIKRQMTWRVWLATLLAIAIRVVWMAILHYMGWLDTIWMENIPHLSWQLWLLSFIVSALAFLSAYLPLKFPSEGSGIFYLITTALFIITYIVWNVCYIYYPVESLFI